MQTEENTDQNKPVTDTEEVIDNSIKEENPNCDSSEDTQSKPVEVVEEKELSPEDTLKQDLQKWKEQALRAAAELDNFRKRSAREKSDAIRFGNQKLVEDLLPVIDNFSMGMDASEKDSGSMIYMGMQMVQKQLDQFLESQGVSTMAVKPGDTFDPNVHDAMSQEVSTEFKEEQIIRIMRKGYMIGERLIRPANVVVAKVQEEQPKGE